MMKAPEHLNQPIVIEESPSVWPLKLDGWEELEKVREQAKPTMMEQLMGPTMNNSASADASRETARQLAGHRLGWPCFLVPPKLIIFPLVDKLCEDPTTL